MLLLPRSHDMINHDLRALVRGCGYDDDIYRAYIVAGKGRGGGYHIVDTFEHATLNINSCPSITLNWKH